MDKGKIAFITDFGTQDGYVGVMKGVIAGIDPEASVIDITHDIPPQDISGAAVTLKDSYRYFPKGTIFVVIVDPGVGGNRRPIAIETDDYIFIGPDNGIFTPIYESGSPFRVFELINREIFLPETSSTFHGRDIFSPAAAHISRGFPVSAAGVEIYDYLRISLPAPEQKGERLIGEVSYVDTFGNLTTNISKEMLYRFSGDEDITVSIYNRTIPGLKRTYSDAERGETLSLIGSSGRLEIAVNQGSAAGALGATRGSTVEIRRGVRQPVRYRMNLFLFIATIITTLFAGALQQGVNPFLSPLEIYRGLPFSLTLITILLIHEMGHYTASVHHRVQASLPYFIPAPSFIGTFGAVIAMKELPRTRKALLDIGVAGPLAGFVMAIAAYSVGLYLPSGESVITISPVGESILSKLVIWLTRGEIPENASILIHPIGFAGWLGLFVTNLNLLPIGQLDGGHITYAMFGERHRFVAGVAVIILIFLGFFVWPGWLFWAALTLLIGIRHPRPMDPYTPLDSRRKTLGIIALIIFVITFMPSPFAL